MPGCPKRYTDPSSLRKHVKTYRHFPPGAPPSDSDEAVNRSENNHIKVRCQDEGLHCNNKQMTASNVPINTCIAAVPDVLKTDCNEASNLQCEDQQAKACENEHCCSPPLSARSPLPCSKLCCVGSKADSVPPHANTHLLWNGHDVHYSLFRSWINADLALLSRSVPWTSGLSFWNHPLLCPSTGGVISDSSVSDSGFSMDMAKYSQVELSTEVPNCQDKPLDLTVHRAGTRV